MSVFGTERGDAVVMIHEILRNECTKHFWFRVTWSEMM